MPKTIYFTGDTDADALLTSSPLALLIAMLLDQQVPMEWAFRGPLELQRRLGGLDAKAIAAMTPEAVVEAFVAKPALHRYPASMAKRVHELCVYVVDQYGGRAENIWKGTKSGEELLARLLDLPGYGPQKAKIFLAILGKRLGIAPGGWEEAADVYGQPGHRSIADVDGPGAVEQVRTYKQAMKAKASSAGSGASGRSAKPASSGRSAKPASSGRRAKPASSGR